MSAYRIKNPEGCIWYIEIIRMTFRNVKTEDRLALALAVKRLGLTHQDRAMASEAARELSQLPAVLRTIITRVETKVTLTFENGDALL